MRRPLVRVSSAQEHSGDDAHRFVSEAGRRMATAWQPRWDVGEREAKVRAEYEAWYPALLAGVWYPANRLREAVVAQLRSGQPRWEPQGRLPGDHHFEFRGGDTTPRKGRRTRRTDGQADRPSPGDLAGSEAQT
jgi:hypothetical protein